LREQILQTQLHVDKKLYLVAGFDCHR